MKEWREQVNGSHPKFYQFYAESWRSLYDAHLCILIGLVVRVPIKQLLKASVTVGCGFIGTFMVMDLLAEYIGPISTGLVEKFNLSLDVIDVGWPVTGSFAWAVPIAPLILSACLH